MIVRSLFSLLSTCALLSACGARPEMPASKLDGHFESSNAKESNLFKGGQIIAAEYAPVQGVVISLPLLKEYGRAQMAADILHSSVDSLWITVPQSFSEELDGPSFSELRSLAGQDFSKVKLVRQSVAGSLTVWARDWAPLSAKTDDGTLRLLDFNYYADRPADDATARSLLPLLPVERVSVPVYNEGGNFMSNSLGACFMTTRVTDANASKDRNDDMILSANDVKTYYRNFAGCKQVQIFPRMPYEGTGHIDMWAKFLNDKTVLVGELREELFSLPMLKKNDSNQTTVLRNYLNERAKDIEDMGYTVVRVPMPAPIFRGGDVFRSYTNSLTVNGNVLVPRYVKPAYEDLGVDGEYEDAKLLASYEKEVEQAYASQGFHVYWVESDALIAQGGAVHCTTMQISR